MRDGATRRGTRPRGLPEWHLTLATYRRLAERQGDQPRTVRLHAFLAARMFYPLFAASCLALVLFGARWLIDGWQGPRLHLNLALAWIPYLCALWASGMKAWTHWRRWLLLLPLPVWFAVLFPNGPYLVTDFMYLGHLGGHTWFNIGIFMTFAMCGLYLCVGSLYLMHTLVRSAFGEIFGWILVVLAVGASGIGVLLGRFLRRNSWELFLHPTAVWHQLLPHGHVLRAIIGPLGFVAMFAAMLAVFYFMFLSIRRSLATPEELKAESSLDQAPPDSDDGWSADSGAASGSASPPLSEEVTRDLQDR